MIPYIIAIARPDWKRPYCEIITHSAENEELLFEKFNKIIVDEMIELSLGCDEKFETYSDFHDKFFNESYMSQAPIEIKYFINGLWMHYIFDQDRKDEINRKIMTLYSEKYDELTKPIDDDDET
jgi:hypothetical protein